MDTKSSVSALQVPKTDLDVDIEKLISMDKKSSVSALQEYCAQTKIGSPVYDYIDGEDGGYICKVVLMDLESFGNGRSKRNAKHLAAANILRKVQHVVGTDFKNNPNSVVEELTNINRDMLKELRDYCVRHDMPLPSIEIVQQSGTPNAPEFVACCSVASIKRYGKSDKKKDARQRAAIEMLCIISNDTEMCSVNDKQLVSNKPNSAKDVYMNIEDVETERRRKFKTYRDLTEAGGDENCSIKMRDRHNYFKSYFPHLKAEAFKEINSNDYPSSKTQLIAVLTALKLVPQISELEATTIEPLLQIDLNSEYNCVFIGLESQIYKEMIEYFRLMLT